MWVQYALVRRAERQLAAATAQTGAATADLFPKFSLTGTVGKQSSTFHGLSKSQSNFWSVGPAVAWPIFDGGRIRANIRVQNALQEQAATTYESAVLTALKEVEDALTAYYKERSRHKDLTDAVEVNRKSVELANQLFILGRTSFLNVLDAERALYAAEDSLAQSERTAAMEAVTLYKALGGGWGDL